MLRSSILLLVPEAEPIVGEHRMAHDPAAFAGIGAHVTLLFPFMPAPQIDDATIARIAATFGRGPLELCFDRVECFPGLCYLAPDDDAEIVGLIRGLQTKWPEYPLYEGKFPRIVPHLTIAHGADDVLDAVTADVAPKLPLVTTIERASLFVEDASIWHERASFAL